MATRRQWIRQLWKEQPGLYRGYLVDVLTAVAIGLALLLGGRQRTVAPAWETLNDNGGPTTWGIVFLAVAGVLILATFVSHRAMLAALWLAATLYALMGWWFLHNALPAESSISFVGAIMQFRAAFMHCSRAEAYRAGPARRGDPA